MGKLIYPTIALMICIPLTCDINSMQINSNKHCGDYNNINRYDNLQDYNYNTISNTNKQIKKDSLDLLQNQSILLNKIYYSIPSNNGVNDSIKQITYNLFSQNISVINELKKTSWITEEDINILRVKILNDNNILLFSQYIEKFFKNTTDNIYNTGLTIIECNNELAKIVSDYSYIVNIINRNINCNNKMQLHGNILYNKLVNNSFSNYYKNNVSINSSNNSIIMENRYKQYQKIKEPILTIGKKMIQKKQNNNKLIPGIKEVNIKLNENSHNLNNTKINRYNYKPQNIIYYGNNQNKNLGNSLSPYKSRNTSSISENNVLNISKNYSGDSFFEKNNTTISSMVNNIYINKFNENQYIVRNNNISDANVSTKIYKKNISNNKLIKSKSTLKNNYYTLTNNNSKEINQNKNAIITKKITILPKLCTKQNLNKTFDKSLNNTIISNNQVLSNKVINRTFDKSLSHNIVTNNDILIKLRELNEKIYLLKECTQNIYEKFNDDIRTKLGIQLTNLQCYIILLFNKTNAFFSKKNMDVKELFNSANKYFQRVISEYSKVENAFFELIENNKGNDNESLLYNIYKEYNGKLYSFYKQYNDINSLIILQNNGNSILYNNKNNIASNNEDSILYNNNVLSQDTIFNISQDSTNQSIRSNEVYKKKMIGNFNTNSKSKSKDNSVTTKDIKKTNKLGLNKKQENNQNNTSRIDTKVIKFNINNKKQNTKKNINKDNTNNKNIVNNNNIIVTSKKNLNNNKIINNEYDVNNKDITNNKENVNNNKITNTKYNTNNKHINNKTVGKESNNKEPLKTLQILKTRENELNNNTNNKNTTNNTDIRKNIDRKEIMEQPQKSKSDQIKINNNTSNIEKNNNKKVSSNIQEDNTKIVSQKTSKKYDNLKNEDNIDKNNARNELIEKINLLKRVIKNKKS